MSNRRQRRWLHHGRIWTRKDQDEMHFNHCRSITSNVCRNHPYVEECFELDSYSYDIDFEYWMMNDRYDEGSLFGYLLIVEVPQRVDWIHTVDNVRMCRNHYGIDEEIDDVEYDHIPKLLPLPSKHSSQEEYRTYIDTRWIIVPVHMRRRHSRL